MQGPIIIIEDDRDDKDLLEEVLKELNISNKLVWFKNNGDAFQYLKTLTEPPFLIISDVNLPGQSGIEFKKQLDEHEELKKKSIPFIFYSTSADPRYVNDAYLNMTVQGYFKKENSYQEIKNTLKLILEYWRVCKHPNSL